MNPTRRNAVVAAAILAAGIGGTLLGLGVAHSADSPTVTHYEDGSVTIDYHDGHEPLVTVIPDSDAAND